MSRPSHAPSYIDRFRDVAVADVAERLGLDFMAPRGASGGSLGPCPACDADKRRPPRWSARDRRSA